MLIIYAAILCRLRIFTLQALRFNPVMQASAACPAQKPTAAFSCYKPISETKKL